MARRKQQITDVKKDIQDPVLDEIDNKILNIVTADPTINGNQIGNKLIQLGVVKSPQSVYARLKKNTYLHGEIQKLRDAIKEDHSRTIFPLAHKRMKQALKNKDLHDKDVFQYVKLAYDKELSTKEENTGNHVESVNIESLQVLINNAKPQ